MTEDRPFVEGTRIQGERLASAALGFIGAYFAAGFSDVIAALFDLIARPIRSFRNAFGGLATGLTRAPVEAVRTSYEPLREFVVSLGPFGFVAAIGFVVVLGWVALQGRDLLG